MAPRAYSACVDDDGDEVTLRTFLRVPARSLSPCVSQRRLAFLRKYSQVTMEHNTSEGEQKKREDKRIHSQLRPIDTEQGLLNRADGSAKYSQGFSLP